MDDHPPGIETTRTGSDRLKFLDLMALILGFGVAFTMPLRLRLGWPERRYWTPGVLAQNVELQTIEWTKLATHLARARHLREALAPRRNRQPGGVAGARLCRGTHAHVCSRGVHPPSRRLALVLGRDARVRDPAAALIVSGRAIRGVRAAMLASLLFLTWTWGPSGLLGRWLDSWLYQFIPGKVVDSLVSLAAYTFLAAPQIVMLGLPLAATIAQRRRSPPPRWTWVDWVGVTSVIANLVADALIVPSNWFGRYSTSYWLASSAVHLGGWCLMLAVAWMIQRHFAPMWDRWLGVGYDGSDLESPHLET